MSLAFAVTTSDGTPQPSLVQRIYVGVTGDVAVVFRSPNTGVDDAASVVLKALPVGMFSFEAPVSFIKATGTTATNLVAFTV